jgi:hypothetical protein
MASRSNIATYYRSYIQAGLPHRELEAMLAYAGEPAPLWMAAVKISQPWHIK